jgi:outer membrane murein-binding lipoprotein Lpp
VKKIIIIIVIAAAVIAGGVVLFGSKKINKITRLAGNASARSLLSQARQMEAKGNLSS